MINFYNTKGQKVDCPNTCNESTITANYTSVLVEDNEDGMSTISLQNSGNGGSSTLNVISDFNLFAMNLPDNGATFAH